MRTSRLLFAGVVCLAVATLLAYWPALHGGFLFDDDAMVTGSALVKASDGLRRMWLTTEPIDYWPLTNSSLWFEWRLWGSDPTGYHVTNVLLHIGSACLLWSILRRLTVPGAWFGAMLFALHPANVQSVAWIAQRKNTLAMFWFLVAIAAFLRAARRHRAVETATPRPPARRAARRRDAVSDVPRPDADVWYWVSLAAFTLAMLSKGSVAILPGVLLLLIWWETGRLTMRDVMRIVPFAVVAVALTGVNVWFQMRMSDAGRDVTVLQRLLGAGGVIWFYLGKALWPTHLTFVYRQWEIDPADVRWWLPAVGALVATAVLIRQRERPLGRALLAGWIFFCMALLPVMGFTDVYFMKYSLVADHYEYLALVAVASLAGGFFAGGFRGSGFRGSGVRGSGVLGSGVLGSGATKFGGAVFAVVIATCFFLTWRQAHLYAGPEELYRATIAQNPDAWPIRNNLGALLLEQDHNEEAAMHLEAALRTHPDFVQAHNNFCNALARLGRMGEALAECTRALQLDPDRSMSHTSLGVALASTGRMNEARAAFERALALNPDSVQAHSYLADLLLAQGDPAGAARHFRAVLAARPQSAGARDGLGRALQDLGDASAAERTLREAIQLAPDAADPHRHLADVLMEQGRVDDAIAEYRLALARDPNSAEAHNNFGVALARAGQTADAIEHLRRAIQLDPSFTDAQANLQRVEKR